MYDGSAAGLLPPLWWQASVREIAALTPVQVLDWPLLAQYGVEVAIKRDDLLHPFLCGNKFYKLHGHIQAFQQSGKPRWLTFGGAFSNHLHAFAKASAELAIPAVAVIRGERAPRLSATLRDVEALGVQLMFISRSDYRRKASDDFLRQLRQEVGDFYCVPEGGSGILGAQGCVGWVQQSVAMAPWTPTAMCLAAGTGCSTAGAVGAGLGLPVHAFLALKGTDVERARLRAEVVALARLVAVDADAAPADLPPFALESDYHCGGYARFPEVLRKFMAEFELQQNIPLDPVYTAKMFSGIAAKAQAGHWPAGSRLLVLHSGGLQGRRGFAGLQEQ